MRGRAHAKCEYSERGPDHHHKNAHESHYTHPSLDLEPMDDMDAHQRQHALEIQQKFANYFVTTGQIIMFGLTGGLRPSPASVTVLLICLQLRQITVGVTLPSALASV